MINIDGSLGEGGGQILRTSLTLSMITGQGFRMRNIRSKRKKPGLMRQHLACILASQKICEVEVAGAEIGSTELNFQPKNFVQSGEYNIDIGSAGSTGLVFQTLFPALSLTDELSILRISGGTHNPMAPCFDFIQHSYLPLVGKMGFKASATLSSYGFYPAGGGEVLFRIDPAQNLQTLDLFSRGEILGLNAEILLSGLYPGIGEAEAKALKLSLPNLEDVCYQVIQRPKGPGNAIVIKLEFSKHSCVFTSIGERSLSSEAVVEQVVKEAANLIHSNAAIDPHLADQLLLIMGLGAGGVFTTNALTDHFKTQSILISRFLSRCIKIEELDGNCFKVEVKAL